ncbi:alpha/beta fold hydrolase [Pseudonocardia sp. N23]|uniref:alpha/beta fold hydrolase n=1 Tax=Pseudonocardia sp. N23 TaxID=1987376 RepID=UPI000BFE861E|nr:alpha/beta hydrolase [Pseudonocardia sp. N23]GAY12941.1 beta-ketoadipate enol-lactone hydrolase [Pseudonocardia sp. N23]
MSTTHTNAPEYTSSVAETALGPVEYAVVGTGVPVLVVHGTPGGIDAAALMARILPRDRVSAILVSRPGYLGTPLGSGATIDEQADLLAALLDHLGIERAGVYTWSGGGPAGYRFAVRHPERVTVLVANAACSAAYELPQQDLATRLMFTTAPGQWLLRVLAAHQPKQYIAGALAGEGDLTKEQLAARTEEVFADPAKRRFVVDLGPTASPDRSRRTGYDNDLAQFAAITSLGLEKITAPTLVVQGTSDSDLPPAQSYAAADAIPGAELLTLDTGTHLALYTHPDAAAAQARVVDFLLAGGRR